MAHARSTGVRPTMVDVARAAGVGLKTVSRVINGEQVRPESLRRVEAAVKELGYRRNAGAAMLRSGQSWTVGLLVYDISESFQLAMAREIEDAVAAHGFRLLVASTRGEHEREASFFEAFCAYGIDGLIVLPAGDDHSYMRPEIDAGIKVVFADRPPIGLDTDAVLATNYLGSREGAEYLLDHGHTRIGFFSLELDNFTALERLRGYSEAMTVRGLVPDNDLVAVWPERREQTLAEIDRMMALPSPPTAFLSAASPLSKNLLWAFRTRGIRPSFVSFDDFELADVVEPPVTAIRQDAMRMGVEAAELLLKRIQGDDSPSVRKEVPTHLIERASVQPPAAGDLQVEQ